MPSPPPLTDKHTVYYAPYRLEYNTIGNDTIEKANAVLLSFCRALMNFVFNCGVWMDGNFVVLVFHKLGQLECHLFDHLLIQ